MRKANLRVLVLPIVLLLGFAMGLKTLAPSIYIEDSGQFVSSVKLLGHNHPPGYVLYNLLAKPFSWLPLGEYAFRVNLASLAAGMGAVLFLYLFMLEFTQSLYVSVFSSLLLFGSRLFWSLASQSEVYQLNLFFLSGALYFLLRSKRSNPSTYSYLLFLWLGLGFNNHYLLILFASLILLMHWPQVFGYGLTGIIKRLFFFISGFSVSLILPIRSHSGVPLDWGSPGNWSGFSALLRRSQFRHLEFSRAVTIADKLKFVQHFFTELMGQFHPALLLVALFGVLWLYRNRKAWCLLICGLLLLGSMGLIWLLQFPYNFENTTRVSVYYLPVYWLIALLLGLGLLFFLERDPFPRSWQVLWLLLPLGVGIINYQQVSLRYNYLGYDLGRNLLVNLPPGADLYAQGNNIVFPLSYHHYVLNKRPDLNIFDLNEGVFPKGNPLRRIGSLKFFTLMRNSLLTNNSYPYGLLLKAGKVRQPFTNNRFFSWRYRRLLAYGEDEVLALRYYFAALSRLEDSRPTEISSLFAKSLEFGQDILWLRNNLGLIYLKRKMYSQAETQFTESLRLAPFNATTYYNLGLVAAQGEHGYLKAAEYFEQALVYSPKHLMALKALSMARKRAGLDE